MDKFALAFKNMGIGAAVGVLLSLVILLGAFLPRIDCRLALGFHGSLSVLVTV